MTNSQKFLTYFKCSRLYLPQNVMFQDDYDYSALYGCGGGGLYDSDTSWRSSW